MNPYKNSSYNHRPRWVSYYYQFQNILNQKPENVLDVGSGGGFTAQVLKQSGVSVATLDIDPETTPDIVGSILAIPMPSNTFDVVTAFETLEHLPFEKVSVALKEMARVSRKKVIFSVPDHAKTLFRMTFKLPFLKEKSFMIRIPAIDNKKFWGPCGHHWELGNIDYPRSKLEKVIKDSGLRLISTKVFNDSAWTRYFILEK